MKRFVVACLCVLLVSGYATATDKKKVLNGFDGGMMVHSGFLKGSLPQVGIETSGAPIGIGGVLRLHLGKHWRLGSEGYVSTLPQLHNGSYIKYGWGGLLGDFYLTAGRFMPFAGLTLGGGAQTSFLMKEEPAEEWGPVGETYFNKKGFMAIDPFVGCEFILTGALHLTLKADWLLALGKSSSSGTISLLRPTGPRIYFGFIFNH